MDDPAAAGQRGRADRADAARRARRRATKTLHFEYDMATGRVTLIEDYKEDAAPVRAGRRSRPTRRRSLFARNHNLFMMDAGELREGAEEPERHVDRRDAADEGRRGILQLRARGRRTARAGATATAAATAGRRKSSSSSRSSAKTGDRRTSRVPAGQRRLGARFEQVLADPPRLAQGQGPLGHQLARESAADARDLPLRDAGRGEHPAVGDVRLRRREPRASVKVKADRFKDQSISMRDEAAARGAGGGGRRTAAVAAGAPQAPASAGRSGCSDSADKIYFTRLSRDLHRLDVCVADTTTGDVKPHRSRNG